MNKTAGSYQRSSAGNQALSHKPNSQTLAADKQANGVSDQLKCYFSIKVIIHDLFLKQNAFSQ